MNQSTRTALNAELGASLPFFLDDLDEAELQALARTLSEARARQAAALEEAIGKSMWFLPWGVRGAVRKALLG